jgi:cell division protein FtsW (lipid II flippase)
MVKQGSTTTEKAILALVSIILITGFILFHTNLSLFEQFVEEDGIVEWLTVLGLLLGVIVCANRLYTLRKNKSWWFLFVVFVLGLLLFFAAGEEISWGQRILGIQSSEFFREKNAQGETNLHNLVVDGVKLNKIIFSIGLIVVLGIYLLVLPMLYRKNQKVTTFVDKSAIPVPHLYQIISILVLFGLTELIRHGKRAELLEAGITLLFFLIVRYPKNIYIFQTAKKDNKELR